MDSASLVPVVTSIVAGVGAMMVFQYLKKAKQWTVRLGEKIPNFFCKTTKGNFYLHDYCTGNTQETWTILFSHPKDFTPVCTTELGVAHKMLPEFKKLGVKMIAVSCDPVPDHHAWSEDVCSYGKIGGKDIDFPIIDDSERELVTSLGMLDAEEKDAMAMPLPCRAVIVLDEKCNVRLSILYPATTGRDFNEIIRTIKSLKLTSNNGLATPANWQPGERVVVTPPVATETAKSKYKNFETCALPSGKPYLRMVDDPVN